MPRFAWSLAFSVLLALPLVSCIDDVPECTTCPDVSGGTIDVLVKQNGLVDSVQVQVDGGSAVTVKRNQTRSFANLSRGVHTVGTTRWFTNDGIPSSRAQTLRIELDRGEKRTVVFHNDFPLVSWAQPRSGPGDPGSRGFHVLRVG